ncbi:MAG: hypothetical protein J3K34DRAFT_522960 [Monoraphidium minutum]|nr:MAG: hypothetical protein J3K34DRAFT_522960 [Monoraphidium minutum]
MSLASGHPLARTAFRRGRRMQGKLPVARPRMATRMSSSQETVPDTFEAAQRLFFAHPSAAAPVAGVAALSACRLQCGPLTLLDLAVAAGVVAFWLVQEWVVHKWLLHSSFEWAGKEVHKSHHALPYFHVSIDPAWMILGAMALAGGAAWTAFGGGPLALTAAATYYSAGLLYEWLHFIVHTRWAPPPGPAFAWLRAVRRHHMLHHMRNEDYWLSFSLPAVDLLFGTLPPTSAAVPLSDMARRAHKAGGGAPDAAAGAAGGAAEVVAAAAAAAR